MPRADSFTDFKVEDLKKEFDKNPSRTIKKIEHQIGVLKAFTAQQAPMALRYGRNFIRGKKIREEEGRVNEAYDEEQEVTLLKMMDDIIGKVDEITELEQFIINIAATSTRVKTPPGKEEAVAKPTGNPYYREQFWPEDFEQPDAPLVSRFSRNAPHAAASTRAPDLPTWGYTDHGVAQAVTFTKGQATLVDIPARRRRHDSHSSDATVVAPTPVRPVNPTLALTTETGASTESSARSSSPSPSLASSTSSLPRVQVSSPAAAAAPREGYSSYCSIPRYYGRWGPGWKGLPGNVRPKGSQEHLRNLDATSEEEGEDDDNNDADSSSSEAAAFTSSSSSVATADEADDEASAASASARSSLSSAQT